MIFDVAVAGGGPAGMATAIEAARAGFSAVVLERRPGPPDKACGEGILPAGVERLRALDVRIDPAGSAPFAGIRYLQERGEALEARFEKPGLGARRTALAAALWARAAELGVAIRPGCEVLGLAPGVGLRTGEGEVRARLVVAADGLHSPLRRQARLDGSVAGPSRFGIRRHLRVAPPAFVEVHWGSGVEAYLTPAGPDRVGLAFLYGGGSSWEDLLQRFPALRDRYAGAPADSEDRGAGPLWQSPRSVVAEGLALVGDAAGYVDAITGEGITLALASAQALVRTLPAALDAGATAASLAPYRRAHAALFAPYARAARAVLLLSRHPALRRAALGAARTTGLFPPIVRALLDG